VDDVVVFDTTTLHHALTLLLSNGQQRMQDALTLLLNNGQQRMQERAGRQYQRARAL